jgi:hypothetical protein
MQGAAYCDKAGVQPSNITNAYWARPRPLKTRVTSAQHASKAHIQLSSASQAPKKFHNFCTGIVAFQAQPGPGLACLCAHKCSTHISTVHLLLPWTRISRHGLWSSIGLVLDCISLVCKDPRPVQSSAHVQCISRILVYTGNQRAELP